MHHKKNAVFLSVNAANGENKGKCRGDIGCFWLFEGEKYFLAFLFLREIERECRIGGEARADTAKAYCGFQILGRSA
jgi:hypothetical protein